MDNFEIAEKVRQMPAVSRYFLGTFPADRLPEVSHIKSLPACFIANTDKAFGPGKHWVCFYIGNRDKVEYFDSFGQLPSKLHSEFLLQFPYIRRYDKAMQSLLSDVCGEYCLYFLQLRCLGLKYQQIVRHMEGLPDRDVFLRRTFA